MQESDPVKMGFDLGWWSITDENYTEFCVLRDQISRVRFQGGLKTMLEDLCYECLDARVRDPNADLSEYVSETYQAMKQWIGE